MQDLIKIFDVTSCHVVRRNANWYFLGLLQHKNDTWDKQSGSKYFLTYCFINLLVNHLLHPAPYVIYRWLKVSKYSEAKRFFKICCTVVSDHTWQVLFFVTIFAHSTTPINEVCLEPLSPNFRNGVNSTFLLGQPNGLRICYTRSRSVETRSSSNIVLSCLHFFPILLNLMQLTIWCQFCAVFGFFGPFKASFPHQIQQNWKVADLK